MNRKLDATILTISILFGIGTIIIIIGLTVLDKFFGFPICPIPNTSTIITLILTLIAIVLAAYIALRQHDQLIKLKNRKRVYYIVVHQIED